MCRRLMILTIMKSDEANSIFMLASCMVLQVRSSNENLIYLCARQNAMSEEKCSMQHANISLKQNIQGDKVGCS